MQVEISGKVYDEADLAVQLKKGIWPLIDPETGKRELIKHLPFMSFPKLAEPEAFERKGKQSGEPKYSANFLFPYEIPSETAGINVRANPYIAQMKLLMIYAARGEFGDGVNLAGLVYPLVKGEKLADAAKAKEKNGEYNRGHNVLTARSGEDYPPELNAIDNGRVVKYTSLGKKEIKKRFYPGAIVVPTVQFLGYQVGQNPPGVAARLYSVFATDKGDRLGGVGVDRESFDAYIGKASSVDPTAGMFTSNDDDIPF